MPEKKPKIHGNVLPGIRKEKKKKKKQRVSGIIRIYDVTKIKRDEL